MSIHGNADYQIYRRLQFAHADRSVPTRGKLDRGSRASPNKAVSSPARKILAAPAPLSAA